MGERVGGGGGGQGTFHPTCHVLHCHVVLRPEVTSHKNSVAHADVDECAISADLCTGQAHGACFNSPGGYSCGCDAGWYPHFFSASGTGDFVCLGEYICTVLCGRVLCMVFPTEKR